MKRSFLWASLPVLVAIAACKSGTTTDSSTGGTTGAGGDCGIKDAKNDEFCKATPGDLSCSELKGNENVQVCGVALQAPTDELQRSSTVKEFPGSGPPKVSCYEAANYPKAPGTSAMVTAKGVAKIFSSGCESKNLSITFHKVKRGGAEDGALGDVVGATVVTPADCKVDGVASANDKCGMRYECNYAYPNVPTETELAIKTEGTGTWSPLIQYNIYIPSSEVVGGEWVHDVRALAADDYTAIPAVAVGGITKGNGVVAGEIHDCEDVRLINATANTDRPSRKFTYFGSDEDNPLPDIQATSTGRLGLYAAFDIVPGPITVAATGLVNGEVVTLGQHRVYVYPDSVTSVTFKGMQPYQLPPTP
ncbi:MAG: hypothetical protein U0414_34525 [Polyangiaceae bacterium]